jgi:tetratricopeptide (TPR) repeat protein
MRRMVVVSSAFHEHLARLIAADQRTQREIANAAHMSEGYLSQLLGGSRTPSPECVKCLDVALDAGGVLVHHARPGGDGCIDVFAAVHAMSTVSTVVIDDCAQMLARYRRQDDVIGSSRVIAAARVQRDIVLDMLGECRGPTRQALADQAGQWQQFYGWLLISVGRYEDAGPALAEALTTSMEAGNADLTATITSYLGHLSYLRGRPNATITLTEAALRVPGICPDQRAYDEFQVARAFAADGDLRAVDLHLERAATAVAEIAAWAGPKPPWHYYRDSWQWLVEEARAQHAASRHDPKRMDRAIAAFRAGAGCLPAGMLGSDWYGEYLTQFAQVLIDAGELDEAVAVLASAGRIAADTKSARVTTMVEEGRSALLGAQSAR